MMCISFKKEEMKQQGCPGIYSGVARLGLIGMNIAKEIKGEKEMKKIRIDGRNAKIIAFAFVAVLLLIGTVGMASAAIGSYTVDGSGSAPVAYYPFNGDAKDKSRNGNDGTVYWATWVDNGGCGKALSFDGDAYVEVPNSNSLNLLDELTIEAWVKPTNWGGAGYGRIVDKGNAYVLHISQNGKPNSFSLTLHGIVATATADSNSVILNEWNHLASVWDGSDIRFYSRGILVGTTPASGTIPTTSNPFLIGKSEAYKRQFNGLIDEVRIYNYAKTQSQIQEDMRKCTPSTPTAAAGPTPTTPTPTKTITPTVTTSITECDSTARAIINAVGGCDALDKSKYPAIYKAGCKITKEYLLGLLNDALADDGKITSDEKKQLLDALNTYLEMRP